MVADLEITTEGVASFAFTGSRTDIWHRLGQQFDGGSLMTADEAQRLANMDRRVYIEPAADIDGADWAVDRPNLVILDGKLAVTDDGDLLDIPRKIVGLTGVQGAAGHTSLQMSDRFELAEAAIHASNGAAVWSTAGLIRNGRQGFATMEAPPVVIDPNGVADLIRRYMTITWSFDGSRATELGNSSIRVVCANTQEAHRQTMRSVIKVKMTAGSYNRFQAAADHWALAQDEDKALRLQGNRMIAVANGKRVLKGLAENVLGLKQDATASNRQNTLRSNKLTELHRLYAADTNSGAVGDNGWAAYQTVVEYLDWFSPVKSGDMDETEARLANQFDGTYATLKAKAADYVLSAV